MPRELRTSLSTSVDKDNFPRKRREFDASTPRTYQLVRVRTGSIWLKSATQNASDIDTLRSHIRHTANLNHEAEKGSSEEV